jgi:hypothetical protein
MRQLVKNLLMLMMGHAFLGAFVAELQIALRLFKRLAILCERTIELDTTNTIKSDA